MKAHVDINTGEIHGCKKGSKKWLHEKGHLVFNSEKSFWLLVQSWSFHFWMSFVLFAFVYPKFYPLAVIFWAIYIFIGLYEEWWCNQYAEKNFQKV